MECICYRYIQRIIKNNNSYRDKNHSHIYYNNNEEIYTAILIKIIPTTYLLYHNTKDISNKLYHDSERNNNEN